MYNTIIIGAGPVGSYLAGKLARLGYKVLVLEKKMAAGQDICCTGIVSKECLDLIPIDKNLIIRQVSSARFLAPSGKPLRLWRSHETAYVTDRPALNLALADHAQQSGARYLFGTQVADIQAVTDHLCVTVSCGEEKKLFEAETAVIATGFGSPLPGKLGLGEISDFTIGAQAEVNMIDPSEMEIYFDQRLAPGGFAWLVPTRDNRGLAGLLTHQQPERHLNKLLSSLKTQGKITSTEVILGYEAIPLRPLPKTYADRILVVGEAAGQVKPTTGGGIYYGLMCADIAADALHQAFQAHDFSESRLASYQKGWLARLDKELQVSYWAYRLYKKLDNRQIEHLHNFISNNGIPQFIAELDDFSFDWHSELILKTIKHLAVTIPAQAIKSLIKHNATIDSLNCW
ncbi:MAG: NAD(P)/FAD-dependent oxidoreductase [Dehalococcoidia bacterium]|nr:NAD(P)/FAD-dependent oxidoreductase [Dehalococcoidia bacterium]